MHPRVKEREKCKLGQDENSFKRDLIRHFQITIVEYKIFQILPAA